MSRPPILPLPDDQVAILVRELQPILLAYPVDGRDHRPFVREFIAAVYTATGRSFSPPIYRKLLQAHAPGRSPSTDTLASEKKAFDLSLAAEADAGRQIEEGAGRQIADVVQRAVEIALARQGRAQPDRSSNDSLAHAQLDFLQTRLGEAERSLAETRAQAARLAGELLAAQTVRDALAAQVDAGNQLAQTHVQQIERLTVEVSGLRSFSMTAIDAARGETRAQKERAAHLEALLKTEKSHTEVFRRLAYKSGAAIPPSLLEEPK